MKEVLKRELNLFLIDYEPHFFNMTQKEIEECCGGMGESDETYGFQITSEFLDVPDREDVTFSIECLD